MEQTGGVFVEQVIRPTGLIDPPVEIRPARSQVDDLLGEIREVPPAGYRTLVTTLTKRMAEDLTEYLHENGIRVRYMHSDIDTLERIEILRDLRLGAFDVLVGINLLREGLDIPECALVAILDADKEGFLRSETSLVQTIGRAARNVDGRSSSMPTRSPARWSAPSPKPTAAATSRSAYNEATRHHAARASRRTSPTFWNSSTSATTCRPIPASPKPARRSATTSRPSSPTLEKRMREAAANLDFEEAARLRDELKRLRETELAISDDPLASYAEVESPVSGREKGKHNKGRAIHRTVGDGGEASPSPRSRGEGGGSRMRGGAAPDPSGADVPTASRKAGGGLFAKPSLDNMGPGTDMPTPAARSRARCSRSSRTTRRTAPTMGCPTMPAGRCSARTRSTR